MTSDEILELRKRIAKYKRNSTRTSWLLRQLIKKIGRFPSDLYRRFQRSIQKRTIKESDSIVLQGITKALVSDAVSLPFFIHHEFEKHLDFSAISEDSAIKSIRNFENSAKMRELVKNASLLEPDIGLIDGEERSYFPPWNDLDYINVRRASELISKNLYDSIILMPAGRVGGADLVAAILSRTLAIDERVLILRTDDAHWDRPDWYSKDIPSVDVSEILNSMQDPKRGLYVLLCEIGAKRIFNVNSRLAFETFVRYGQRLSTQFQLYCYYFCADRSPEGIEQGYPVQFFANIFPFLTTAIFDTNDLAETLTKRFSIPPSEISKVRTIYTPAQLEISVPSLAQTQSEQASSRRPNILWAGRLDRQKRFDLAVDVARAMPDVDFKCWGKAVLDAPPKLQKLPSNLSLSPPFSSYSELPLSSCDGWLYTSSWDGLPTILIELGALGMPIAASAVGGVPELIDETTGWIFEDASGVDGAVRSLRAMLSDPNERRKRAAALQERVRERHSASKYRDEIASL